MFVKTHKLNDTRREPPCWPSTLVMTTCQNRFINYNKCAFWYKIRLFTRGDCKVRFGTANLATFLPAIQLRCKPGRSVMVWILSPPMGSYAKGWHKQVAPFGEPFGNGTQWKGRRSLKFYLKFAFGTQGTFPLSAVLLPKYHDLPRVLLFSTPDVCLLPQPALPKVREPANVGQNPGKPNKAFLFYVDYLGCSVTVTES